MLPDQVPGLQVQVPNSPSHSVVGYDVLVLTQNTEGLDPCDTIRVYNFCAEKLWIPEIGA